MRAAFEYCGCQANRAIEQLTGEHDRALDHVRDVEAAAHSQDAAAAHAATAALVALLAPHNTVEEKALFPALAGEFPEHIDVLLEEHELIQRTLGEMAWEGPPGDGWGGRLLQAMDVLRNHIRKEEDGVFPAALSVLASQDWDRLEQVRLEVCGVPSRAGPDIGLEGYPSQCTGCRGV